MIWAQKQYLFRSLLNLGLVWTVSSLSAQQGTETDLFHGGRLNDWVAQAMAQGGPTNLAATVEALSQAVQSNDPNVKRKAADALAVLGPKAKAALPALLAQFGHEFPWVRESCQAAVGSMGKEAVPALIETFENDPGGPRLRAAFVLGSIGSEAKAAVPVILRIMKDEPPVSQERLKGVLSQIDPEQFGRQVPTGKARYEGTPPQVPVDVATADWPQFHGPARDSICREKGLLQSWPAGGPKLLWTLRGLGRGYSTVSIAGGKLFTMGDRADANGAEAQYVLAYDLETRAECWAAHVGPAHTDGGPRCAPTVDGQSVYALGTDGDLVCLDADSGQRCWARNLVNDFQGKFMSVWKFSESPLIDGDRLICTPGGSEAMMVALNKQTGEVIWKCAIPELGEKGLDGCGYSSVIAADICGVRQYVQLVGRGVIGVEAVTGRFLWGYNNVANTVANITHPIAHGDYVFATTAYNTGSVLLKIARNGDVLQAEEVYFIDPRDFQNHHGGVVLLDKYIYGGHGANRGDPACVELATGKIVWKQRAPARGSAGVLYADGHLVLRYDRGEVLWIEASPDGLHVKGQFTTPDEAGLAWAHPVIHRGKLYLRHANSLFCYDLSSESR